MLPTEPHIPRAESQLIHDDMSRALPEIALGVSQALPGVAAPEMVVGHEGRKANRLVARGEIFLAFSERVN